MSIIEVKADSITLSKVVTYLQAQKVEFTIKDSEESPYDPEVVEMVLKAKQGKASRVYLENIWEGIL